MEAAGIQLGSVWVDAKILVLLFALPAIAFPLLYSLRNKSAVNFISGLFLLVPLALSATLFASLAPNSSMLLNLQWLQLGSVNWSHTILLDRMAIQMLLMLYIVAYAVFIFSIYYMKNEQNYARYFSFLMLFVFAMSMFVISQNLFFSYIFWELLGFCSYVFIGFWNTREAAIKANKKAFILNRFGDVGFIVGMFLLYSVFQSFDLLQIKASYENYSSILEPDALYRLRIAGYCFLLAVMAKSAQFPLHVWLPDAMEGPTPISALIHAATMVVAGIYLLLRISFILQSDVLIAIASIGAFTAMFAALVACFQFDIKKILAYSTISQLAYMMIAIGVKSNEAALLHLLSHAFFKAALFLLAAVIIHYVKTYYDSKGQDLDPQDIRNMGSLHLATPVVSFAFIIAAASLAGVPFLSGYYSKDAIIEGAWQWAQGQASPWFFVIPALALLTALLTSYYLCRQVYYIFIRTSDANFRKERMNILELIPVVVLVLLSISIFPGKELPVSSTITTWAMVMVFTGFFIAYLQFGLKRVPSFNADRALHRFFAKGMYVDAFYTRAIPSSFGIIARAAGYVERFVFDGLVKATHLLHKLLATIADFFDRKIVDGLVNAIALGSRRTGDFLRAFQTGKLQSYYALSFLLLILFILMLYI
jgi:NADH-quinone oxidoreductase subunit L